MADALLIGFAFWLLSKLAGGGDLLSNIFHVSHPSSGPAPLPSPDSTTTVVNFPMNVPAGMPPWPSGWKVVSPVTPEIVARARDLLATMSIGQVKYEQGPAGSWIAYYKHQFDGKTGVTAHEPRTPLLAPQPPMMPEQHNVVSPEPPAASPAPAPSSSGRPTIRKGSRGEAVKAWQRVIGLNDDGNFGKGTEAATKQWQSSHGLKPDGVVGPDTWATVAAS